MAASRWDVAVAGAGPAGAVTAALLAQRGHRVILLDRAHFPRRKVCAEYMSPGVDEVLRRLGLEVPVAGRRPVSGMEIVAPRGTRFLLRYGEQARPCYGFTMSRLVFDEALVMAAGRRGVEVVEGVVVRRAVVEDGVVRGLVASRNGREMIVPVRLTIVADGARSVLARSLRLAVPPRWPVRFGLVAHYQGPTSLADAGQMHVGYDGYCGLAPMADNLTNVALVVPCDAVRQAGSAPAFYEAWIAAHPSVRSLLGDCRRVTPVRGLAPIGARARRASLPGALLVGDAASFFDPFTGEGIYRALRGAELAAAVGDGALEAGDLAADRLQHYDVLRRHAFHAKQAVTTLIQIFVRYPGLLEYVLPRLASRPQPAQALGQALGDLADARTVLQPKTLWATLRP